MGSYAGQRRQTSCVSGWIKFAFLGVIICFCFKGALCQVEPTESQCRPYIEKALKEQHHELDEQIPDGTVNKELLNDQEESPPTDELTDSTEGSVTNEDAGKENDDDDDDVDDNVDEAEIKTEGEDDGDGNEDSKTEEDNDAKDENDVKTEERDDDGDDKDEDDNDGLEIESKEGVEKEEDDEKEDETEDQQEKDDEEEEKPSEVASEDQDDDDDDKEALEKPIDIETQEVEMDDEVEEDDEETEQTDGKEDTDEEYEKESADAKDEVDQTSEGDKDDTAEDDKDDKVEDDKDDEAEDDKDDEAEDDKDDKAEDDERVKDDDEDDDEKGRDEEVDEHDKDDDTKLDDDDDSTKEVEKEEPEKVDEKDDDDDDHKESTAEEEDDDTKEKDDSEDGEASDKTEDKTEDDVEEDVEKEEATESQAERPAESEAEDDADQEAPEEEELIKEMVIPENLRPRDHIDKILKLEDTGIETVLEKTIDSTLKALKGLYDNAIKPLEMLYKYRDLSNRHFGDPEIFSKPLILFMGPWSGGKSSTINYLLDNEFSHTTLRTGAEPSPAYFNILMYGEEEEILDGTQLAADWTFSGLQKFGQGLLDRLKGVKLPNKLLEKVNIVEIPGILEIRKQVQRLFPFNDACQWFIDRADIIFLVYDPSKLDVGPETEAILDQLKGREYQTRIILNKADQVKPEELMRVQGTLIWNISPLMSSSEPPIMYSTSLWSLPYEVGAPTRLLQAQERAFLKDLREAIDKRVENKISSARRFAVRVRNHAKMVDCYLTTYYNHKTIFGNRKKISDDIIEYPQKYHIYEGLSTLTNISRYDLPDPDVYRDFFKINPLYEFKKLSETCTYFRGCPINKLDVAIAYDLPELVGKYKKAVETAKEQLQKENS